jgi:multidrug efflux pump subunit AcrB
MAVAVALIYLVLVARFRSLRVPLVVLSAVPLGLIGVLPGFALLAPFGVYFSATAMIGVIALAGIVVRNSIVLVEFVEERIAHGTALREALIDAGTVRARPIALTAAAGMLSALVIAMDPVWSGLAWALVFGMGASAALSLFVVPLLYAMVAHRPAAPPVPPYPPTTIAHTRLQPI